MDDQSERFQKVLEAMGDRVVLCLFIAGPTPLSLRAIENLEAVCREQVASEYEIKVVDVRKNPKAAGTYDLLAAPTLERQHPPPVARIVGDLSDRNRLRSFLRVRVAKP